MSRLFFFIAKCKLFLSPLPLFSFLSLFSHCPKKLFCPYRLYMAFAVFLTFRLYRPFSAKTLLSEIPSPRSLLSLLLSYIPVGPKTNLSVPLYRAFAVFLLFARVVRFPQRPSCPKFRLHGLYCLCSMPASPSARKPTCPRTCLGSAPFFLPIFCSFSIFCRFRVVFGF